MRQRRYHRPVRRPRNVVLRSKFKMERRRRARMVVQYLLILGLGGASLWLAWRSVSHFLFRSDYFKIRKIEVRGLKNVSQSEIMALVPFRPGDNQFSFWLSDAEDTLLKYKPELRKVNLSRRWHRIVVDLEERQPVACVMVSGQRLGLDDDNKPFPLRGKWYREFFPEIAAKSESERREMLGFIRTFSPEAPELFSQIVRLYPEPVDSVVFELKDSLKVYWGTHDRYRTKAKLRRLAQVLDDARSRFNKIDYVDLSYFDDGRILVKPAQAAKARSQTAQASKL